MTIGLADTSIFVALESGRPFRTELLPDVMRTSVITIGELRVGVLIASDPAVRAARLATLTRALRFEPVPIDDAVAEAWAGLRVALADTGRRMAVNDSWIAATAIAMRIPIVTQDDDFLPLAGLDVVHV
jgi:predicted nucleic acid-binding protein